MSMRRQLKMHPPQNSRCRRGVELLPHRHLNPMLRQLPLVKGLHERPALVLEDKGREDFYPRERLVDELHGRRCWLPGCGALIVGSDSRSSESNPRLGCEAPRSQHQFLKCHHLGSVVPKIAPSDFH